MRTHSLGLFDKMPSSIVDSLCVVALARPKVYAEGRSSHLFQDLCGIPSLVSGRWPLEARLTNRALIGFIRYGTPRT